MESKTVLLACAASVCVALSCGCTSLDSSRQSLQLRPSDIVSTVFQPEYKVRPLPVTATAVQKHFLFFSWGDADLYSDQYDDAAMALDKPEVRRLKKAASTMACDAANCDLLVATTYQFERSGFMFSKIRCTVKGFPADVVSVSPMTSPAVTREIKRVQELDPTAAPVRRPVAPAAAPAAPAPRPAAPVARLAAPAPARAPAAARQAAPARPAAPAPPPPLRPLRPLRWKRRIRKPFTDNPYG